MSPAPHTAATPLPATTPLPEVDVAASLDDVRADTVVVGLFRGEFTPPGTEDVLARLGVASDVRTAAFRAHVGEVLVLAGRDDLDRVVVVGLGRMADLSPEVVRRAAGAAGRAMATVGVRVATTLALVDPADAYVQAVAEGLLLGIHRDERFKSEPSPSSVAEAVVVVPSGSVDRARVAVAAGARHAAAQVVARELVATPAGHLGPEEMVDWVATHMPEGLEVEVDDEAALRDKRCGGLLAVAAGSTRPPRLIRIRHRVDNPVASIALVGKGITFDSGGLSLKPPAGQMVMKKDMGGAATIVGVMTALAGSDVPLEVTAWLAMAENMPSGTATRPGDVITIANGSTVEVLNTDAEGRLVLADALSLAAATSPDAMIDVATLTGAVQHAVGKRAFGVFGNDDALLDRVLTAAEEAGEMAWHLPLWADLDEELDSEIADTRNVVWPGDKERGGATIAGLFLQRFVDDVPWIHLDISGAAWAEEDRGHLPKNATGTGVRTLLHLLEATKPDG